MYNLCIVSCNVFNEMYLTNLNNCSVLVFDISELARSKLNITSESINSTLKVKGRVREGINTREIRTEVGCKHHISYFDKVLKMAGRGIQLSSFSQLIQHSLHHITQDQIDVIEGNSKFFFFLYIYIYIFFLN